MSLQLWLPLNGNVKNKGVFPTNNFSVTNTTCITVSDEGKIGKCYNFNSTVNNTGIFHADAGFMAKCINNHSFSLCIWIQTTATDTCALSLSYGLRIFVGDSSHTYVTLYNTSRTVGCASSTAVNDGNWHHICATYNVDTNKIAIYIDGVVKNEVSYTSGYTYASSWTNGLFIGKDPNNSTVSDHYLFKGKLNDVRVYDHALSVAEIKEIAKGLVVHYKLDDFYSNDNLIVNGYGDLGSENWNNGSYISTTEIPPNHPEIKASMYSGNMTKQYIPIIQNHTYTISGYIKATSGSTGTTYPSIYGYDIDKKFIDYYKCAAGFNNTYKTTLAQPLHKGDTVVYATDLSAWTTGDNYYCHVAIFGYQNSLGEVYPDMIYTQDSPAFGTKTDKSHIDKTNNTVTLNAPFTGEDRPAGTTICQASEGSIYYYPWGGIAVTSITDWVFKTANFKPSTSTRLKAAAYIRWSTYGRCYIAGNRLVDNTAVDNTIVDCSGYSHHGTRSGYLSTSTTTPRFSQSTTFDGSSAYIDIVDPIFPTILNNSFTLSMWIYNADAGDRSILFGNYGLTGSFFNIEKTTAEKVRFYWNASPDITFANSVLTANVFTHLVITKDGSTVKCYINGALKDSSTTTLTGSVPSTANNFRIGSDNRTGATMFKGRISDFRIYASCLSADDVLRLYNTAASVAKTGAMLGYEMKEG